MLLRQTNIKRLAIPIMIPIMIPKRNPTNTEIPRSDTELATAIRETEMTPNAILLYLEYSGPTQPKIIIDYLQKNRIDGKSTPRIKAHLSNLLKEEKVIAIKPKNYAEYGLDGDGRSTYYAPKSILLKA